MLAPNAAIVKTNYSSLERPLSSGGGYKTKEGEGGHNRQNSLVFLSRKIKTAVGTRRPLKQEQENIGVEMVAKTSMGLEESGKKTRFKSRPNNNPEPIVAQIS
jgi:hypothetical protein